jgi:hypothetical protein
MILACTLTQLPPDLTGVAGFESNEPIDLTKDENGR